MTNKLKTLIKEVVRNELAQLHKSPKKAWKMNDSVTERQLESIFRVFHLSGKNLGPTFTFTPRVPKSTWGSIEDDFTKRISLAPSIKKAQEALVSDGDRDFVYAGDIKGYSGDDVETIDLAQTIKSCPSTPGNSYDENFDIESWLLTQLMPNDTREEFEQLDREDKKLVKNSGRVTPKKLPDELKHQFIACVPDAKKTKEMWSIKPVELILVATYGWVGPEPDINDADAWDAFDDEDVNGWRLTELGARVFNAVGSKADEIPYNASE